ncbi:MAG: hypothetical protein HKN17_01055, partial [Rhodothermales bacterium]|nr:hypothetical protein [Rhodothermales bacterium]
MRLLAVALLMTALAVFATPGDAAARQDAPSTAGSNRVAQTESPLARLGVAAMDEGRFEDAERHFREL